jgi:PmbA protein
VGAALSRSPARAFDPAAEERGLLERCEGLVARARDAGAEEAEACGTRARSIAVRFEKGDLKLAQVDEGSTLGLRVFTGKRLGFSSTNQEDERSLAAAARDAVALAKLSPPDEPNRLPDASAPGPAPIRVDPEIAELPIERAVAIGLDLVARTRAIDPRLSIDSAGFEVTRATSAIRSSRGVSASESDAVVSFNVFGMAIDGQDVGGFHYTGDVLRTLGGLDAAVLDVAREFAEVALGNLGAQKAESYRGPVLFAPDAFLEVFVAPLVSAASAIAVQRGRSPLRGRLGERVASDVLAIRDDPTDATLAGACAFDREGTPCGRFAIVEGGILKSFLYNAYAAAVEGRASTGHARGSPRSTPGLGPHAIVVAGGTGGTRDELQRALGRGLFVQRFSGTVDPASGDFSGVAKSARWIEGGSVVRPLRETLISGNAFALLARVLALGSESARCMGSARAPYALIDDVAVTAG